MANAASWSKVILHCVQHRRSVKDHPQALENITRIIRLGKKGLASEIIHALLEFFGRIATRQDTT